MQIIGTAFGWKEAAGGAAGYGVMQAVRYGIARGLFSNEAGQGSAPIAHAAAQTKNPVMQGEIAMIGVFIDTIIICTMTALVILTVQGDFKKSPALMAANACFDAGIEMPINPDATDGAKYGVSDLFPSAYEDGREAKIAAVGPTAQSYLLACQASGKVDVSQEALDASGNPEILMDVNHAWKRTRIRRLSRRAPTLPPFRSSGPGSCRLHCSSSPSPPSLAGLITASRP